MGRQSCDPTIFHSSIALLQERFRQLERAKEIRQQRELLRLLSEVEQLKATATAYESPRLLFQSELILPPTQPHDSFLYLWPSNQSKITGFQINETKNSVNVCSAETLKNKPNISEESDVDTSLHL